MDELIKKLKEVRNAIQILECISPTEHNCNQILGSIHRLDDVIAALRMMGQEAREMDVKQK